MKCNKMERLWKTIKSSLRKQRQTNKILKEDIALK